MLVTVSLSDIHTYCKADCVTPYCPQWTALNPACRKHVLQGQEVSTLCCVALCCVCCVALCCVCCVALRCAVLSCFALRCVALCCVVLCCVVLCCVVLCCVVLCCVVGICVRLMCKIIERLKQMQVVCTNA